MILSEDSTIKDLVHSLSTRVAVIVAKDFGVEGKDTITAVEVLVRGELMEMISSIERKRESL